MHDSVRDGWSDSLRRSPSLEYAGKTHHCTVDNQTHEDQHAHGENLSRPTNARVNSCIVPGPCPLPPSLADLSPAASHAADNYFIFQLECTQLDQRQQSATREARCAVMLLCVPGMGVN